MFQRKRYQFGWLRRKPRRRGPDVWVWVHRSKGPAGMLGSRRKML